MKNILFTLALLVSFNSFGQDFKNFKDWSVGSSDKNIFLTTKIGECIENCSVKIILDIVLSKEGESIFDDIRMVISGDIYPDYDGDNIKVEMIIKDSVGNYSDRLFFNGSSLTGNQGTNFLLVSNPDDMDLSSLFINEFYAANLEGEASEVFIQTTLKNKVKVFKFSLVGYEASFDHSLDLFTKINENPFKN